MSLRGVLARAWVLAALATLAVAHPAAAHFAPLQAPDTFNAAMIGFLDTPATAGPTP